MFNNPGVAGLSLGILAGLTDCANIAARKQEKNIVKTKFKKLRDDNLNFRRKKLIKQNYCRLNFVRGP